MPVKKNPKHNYQCKNCGEIRQGRIIPSSYHCINSTLHIWNDLGLYGDMGYQCSKCKSEVKSQNKPLIAFCPGGDGHLWITKKV
ncbi:MAG TPA: hypothetical protein VNZ49_16055 [Bacteroidia bacterium]|nr:hypothetical protein [Bacteroidia bacterium]